jgi:hypothetical protein
MRFDERGLELVIDDPILHEYRCKMLFILLVPRDQYTQSAHTTSKLGLRKE